MHLLCHLNSDVRVVVVVNVFYEAKGKPLAQRVDSKRGAVSSLGEEEAELVSDSGECTEYVRVMVVFRTIRWIWCNGATPEVGEGNS